MNGEVVKIAPFILYLPSRLMKRRMALQSPSPRIAISRAERKNPFTTHMCAMAHPMMLVKICVGINPPME